MLQQNYEKIAELAIRFGINFRPGQKVVVTAESIHAPFVALLARKLYESGAAFVHTELVIPRVVIHRSLSQREEFLPYVPDFRKAQIEQYVGERWSFIHVGGMEDPDIFKEMNQQRNSIVQKANTLVNQPLMKMTGTGKCSWTLVALPTPKWAEKVTGEKGEKALELMWKDLSAILRLEGPDPIASWKKHSEALQARCRTLNQRKLRELHFTGPGTDLRIGLCQRSKWVGGAIAQEEGEFFPNLPSEEVFTTPDFRLTQGKVKVTRPVNVLGDNVEDAYFEFKDGQVVDFGASYGKHLLESYFSIDPRAKSLGEVALVDGSSPIFKSGRVFHNILFDENAACHIALGRAIGLAFEGSEGLSEEELVAAGANQSLLHTDFMIGSEAVSVEATDSDGRALRIIENGRFVI
ncbi:MAG: aminopeptidase [Oligoflexia bacterium]|nr:aminopeptidase [Oligoflexia bacterium]